MSPDEYSGLMKSGRWTINGSMEGKWFAESYQDAVKWGNTMGHGEGAFRVVQVDVPDDIAGKMHKDPHLDGIGPARYAEIEDLNNPRSRVTWSKEVNYSGCR